MALEISIQESSAGLSSVRATERKKCAETIKDFLTRNAVPSLLTENTLKKKGYTWNILFDDINEFVLKELEKFETSKTFHNVTAPLCANLLHLCVAGANKGKAFINCEKIMEACLYILKDNRMAIAIGDAYLNLLYKHILPYDHYLSFITPSTWEELLDVITMLCLKNRTKLDDFTILRLTWFIMKNGSSCCQFIIPIRDALPKLKQCFLRVESDKKIQEVVIEITSLLIETLASESRLTMCEFTESIIPSLLKFYEQNADTKRKASLFKLLHLMILLHHPQGKLQNEDGSLANNWTIWEKHLMSMLEITCLEVNYQQKFKKHNDYTPNQCTYFYQLAAAVYFQIFAIPSQSDGDEIHNTSKRQKVSYNNNKSFTDLIEELKLNYTPWLGVIYFYIERYGKYVKINELMDVLNFLELLISNNNSNLNWSIFEELTCLILKIIIKHPEVKQDQYDRILLTLWNSCVRNSSSVNAAHKPLHSVIQSLLNMDFLSFQNVAPLIKLYFENGMPVTDASVKTLSCILHKHFSKCSSPSDRSKCFNWLVYGNINSITVENVRDLLLRLVANENVGVQQDMETTVHCDKLSETLFKSIETCVLFSEFELDISDDMIVPIPIIEPFNINAVILEQIQENLQGKLTDNIEKLKRCDIDLLDFVKYVRVVIAFMDATYQGTTCEQMNDNELFPSLITALKLIFKSLPTTVKSSKDVRDKLKLLQCVKLLWSTDYCSIISSEVRRYADEEFFSGINEILSAPVSKEDEEMYEGDEESDPEVVKHNCIFLLAAYCTKCTVLRQDILDFILDPKLYDFSCPSNIVCAFECIQILNSSKVEASPLESIFSLMQGMCRELFRNPKATEKILTILSGMLDRIWEHNSSMKENCYIMMKGYLQRCEKLYYTPHTAALIYNCVAKIIALNENGESDTDAGFKDILMEKMKGNIHNIRLYNIYLLKRITKEMPDHEIEMYLSGLMDVFLINVNERDEFIMKDEATNRALTVLHSFLALAQTNKSSVHKIVTELLHIQKEKSLDISLVKKVLDKITKTITGYDIDTYLNSNILSVIHFWLHKNNDLKDLPLHVFGFQTYESFLIKHMKWLIPADILWKNEGNVKKSNVLNQMKTKLGKSEDNVIELCFSNIVVLCLPYIVAEKYKIDISGLEQYNLFKQTMRYAINMYQATRQILESEKWSNLFVENMSDLVLMAATHLCDPRATKEQFQVRVPRVPESYLYPKEVFSAILRYFGELIDGNIMHYLCSNQAITIFDTMLQLWERVIHINVFELKALALHSFVSFVVSVPLGFDSDAFVCNFTCNSFTRAIKASKNNMDIHLLVQGLKLVLTTFLPEKIELIRKSVLGILSTLLIKKEEGYGKACEAMIKYLTVDMKDCLKESEDVVDFSNTSPQSALITCSTRIEFMDRLKVYKSALTCPSHETLIKLRQFVKLNKHFVNHLCEELNSTCFAEECKKSVIHQVIYALTNILTSTSDEKTVIEACNCLSEIGTYDLKTLVTVPPADTNKVVLLPVKQSFAFVVVTTVTEVLFDENPAFTIKAVAALSDIFKYKEGRDVLDIGDVNVQILKTFLTSNSNDYAVFNLNARNFDTCSDQSYWVPLEKETHHEWLARITTALLGTLASETNYLNALRDVCAIKPQICQKILPALVGLILSSLPESYTAVLSNQLNNFFKYIWDTNFEDFNNSSDSPGNKKICSSIDQERKLIIQYMLSIVDYIRLQKSHYKKRPDRTADVLNYLRLEYDKVAWAATLADLHLSAIYYGELWAVAQTGGVPPSSPETTSNLPGGDNLQRIFRKCFVSIGELDAVDGCGTAHLINEHEKRKHLINSGQYSDALLSHDIALSSEDSDTTDLQLGVVRSLHKSGMHHLALQYLKSMPESDQLNDIKFDCLTYLGDWSSFVDTKDLEEKSKYSLHSPRLLIKAFRYACLKDCLNLQTTQDLESKLTVPLDRAKLAVSRWCKNLNMENCQNVYKVVANLHLFSDIEEYSAVRCETKSISDLLNQWRVEKLPSFHDFKHLETLISQRSLILKHAAKTYAGSLKDIVSLELQYAELGLSNERVQMAQRLLSVVKEMQQSEAVLLVEGQVSWAKGHKEIALSLVKNVLTDSSSDVELTAISLRQYGLWMAESKCDNPRDIINKYLKKSLDVMGRSEHLKTRLKVYYDIAKFADSEYKQVVAYMNSSIYENKLKCVQNMKGTAVSLKSTQQSLLTKDDRKALHTNERLSVLDEAEIASTKQEKLRFLQLAMRYYLLSIKQCEENNLSVFRVISLWLDNPSIELDAEGASFEELLHGIPSRKFIMALPQLTPRLSEETTIFARNLNKIIKRCAIEHPHHTLPILFSLKNSDKDKRILNASEAAGGARAPAHEPRVAAAASLVASLANTSKLANVIAHMEKLCNATISFANYLPKTKENKQKIPSAELIQKLGPLDAVPIPTDTIAIRNDCNYTHLPTLASFEDYFELVGGINCPKKINCRSSDGKRKIMLVKGEDDLRQDAVMQQVFNIVNNLLEKNPVTSRNKLLIRTYKVVPMSRRSGVLEWCEGTMPLGSYLTGSTGAHARYRPQDISSHAARQKFAGIQNSRKNLSEKIAVFMSILRDFKPVFHFFFTEHYLDPVTWYERRLAYTKSVATSSMVGYILGLGDRHVQNILVDKNTAEVVHIDFGIAFDQGKALPTPETIPFRLTQDMVAGFGSSGVEGIFRRCCEKTMQLLRDNHETLLTILEVLLCDPLCSWTTSQPTVASKDVNRSTGNIAGLAERALLAVASKLSGTEGGVAGGVAVPGQVARLIHTAMDPANLCRLFQGWQPYL